MAEEPLIHILNFADAQTMLLLAWLVIIIPFVTGIFLLILRVIEIKKSLQTKTTFKFNENLTGWIGVSGLAGSLVLSIIVSFQYFGMQDLHNISHANIGWAIWEFPFLPTNGGSFNWGIALSPLSVIMMALLAVIAFSIHLYSIEYMHGDSAYTRFFGTLNFFTGSMLGFVLASNLFMAFIFWELLGFSSYLLIGYYWPKASASSAAKKAFLYNKVGDVSFMVGIALLWQLTYNMGTPTLSYYHLRFMAASGELHLADLILPGILIFGGAVGKSAQLPLFGWLPEAMEGPTPVSALLHSSTMVKAGLFLAMRVFFTFYTVGFDLHIESTPEYSAIFIAYVGTFTALAGAMMAITQDDLKKVLAFSTISQLGYIAMAIGAGGLTAAFYHLIAHATFKSLLFLCAGAIIHSIHKPHAYMSELGGLKHYVGKVTRITMATGLLALSGFPLMSGFWSKDAVLLAMEESQIPGAEFLYWIGVITAALTAFYSTKMYILTFEGEARYDNEKVHPGRPGIKTEISLIILALGVLVETVWWAVTTIGESALGSSSNFEYILGSLLGQHHHIPAESGREFAFSWAAAVPSMLAVLLGIGIAYWLYAKGGIDFIHSNSITNATTGFLFKISANRFGFDKAIYWFAEEPVRWVGQGFARVDSDFLDGLVINSVVAGGSLMVADVSDGFDTGVIDGVVNLVGEIARSIGKIFRKLQSGQTPNYALFMVLGLGIILSTYTFFNVLL